MAALCRALVLLAALLAPAPVFAAQDFQDWLKDLRREAVGRGISEHLVNEALPDTLAPDERVVRLDRRQPEDTVTFERYRRNAVTLRQQEARRQLERHGELLRKVEKAYAVEARYIVALWGMESLFGRNGGTFETIPSLATLAYEGRRGAFFRQELLAGLRIVDQGHIPLHQMKGSWAGAMGQCQFMPSSFEKYAQDFNGDGKKDIWRSEEDVFASIAAYLAHSGWRPGQPWGQPARLPENFDNKLLGANVQKPLQFWRAAGVTPAAGHAVFGAEEALSVVRPGGEGYKAYLVSTNYRILLKWNASLYFATAVGQLADSLKN